MNIPIKTSISLWLEKNHKAKQWLWFVALWCGGLATVMAVTYPIKLLIRLAS